jgi:hypothetical protein
VLALLLALPSALPIDRDLDVLPGDPRAALRAAGESIGSRKIVVGGYEFDGAALKAIAASEDEAILRALREGLHRPIDLEDFILFLDDVVSAKGTAKKIVVTADRARSHGILLHPFDVFGKPKQRKRYAERERALPTDDPPLQDGLEPAKDFDPPGPRWTARYQQPASFEARLAELEANNARFGKAMRSLIDQLASHGATIIVESAVRSRARGYLIFGSYYLSRARSKGDLALRLDRLASYNREWKLAVPITWRHPDGFEATVEAARQMADTYGVDFATVEGARRSDHYDGKAVDLVAVDLPRRLELAAPDGAKTVFDLSAPEQSRDVNLTPELIEWIEAHFGVKKLRSDYPHWKDPS